MNLVPQTIPDSNSVVSLKSVNIQLLVKKYISTVHNANPDAASSQSLKHKDSFLYFGKCWLTFFPAIQEDTGDGHFIMENPAHNEIFLTTEDL